MGQLLLFIVVALVVAAIVFGVTVMVSGGDSGLTPVEPDGRAVPLPSDRPLGEEDIIRTKFDTALRGYRMAQVDQALQRAAYDIGYKGELIGVLEAEVVALREGRIGDADVLRRAREAAIAPADRRRSTRRRSPPRTRMADGRRRATGRRRSRRPRSRSTTVKDDGEAGGAPMSATEPVDGLGDAAQPGTGEVTATVIVNAPGRPGVRRVHGLGEAVRVDPVHQGARSSRATAARAAWSRRSPRSVRPCCATSCGWSGWTRRTRSGWCTAARCCAGPARCAARRWPATAPRWSARVVPPARRHGRQGRLAGALAGLEARLHRRAEEVRPAGRAGPPADRWTFCRTPPLRFRA